MLRSRAHTCFLALSLVATAPWAGSACESGFDDPRTSTIVEVLVATDEPLLRTRPALVEGKYERMAQSLYGFYRGTFPLYLYDAGQTRTGLGRTAYDARVYPFSFGDAHPENFGTLRASDGSFAVEPNDFDGADRYPWLWELRRLAVGVLIAARSSNEGDDAAREAAIREQPRYAEAVARGYALELVALANGAPRARTTESGGNVHLEDMFSRSRRDEASRRELQLKTEIVEGRRRLLRGSVDEDDPTNQYGDLPGFVVDAIPSCLERYRSTLFDAPAPAYFALKDAAREYGSGVASFARVRIVLLVEGPTTEPDDDVMLELKELADSGAVVISPQGVHADSVQGRIHAAHRVLWSRPDAEPLWGTSELLGMPVQIRGEFDAYKTLRVSRMVGERGTPEALEALGGVLGAFLAKMHAGSEAAWPGTTAAIASQLDDVDSFVAEQTDVALRYADQVESDHARFREALEVLGPRLGLRPDPTDTPPPELAALYGSPAR